MRSLIEYKREVFSEDFQNILKRIIQSGENVRSIDLTTPEIFELICHGLDSYYEYKVNVICSIMIYFISTEDSYEKLYLEYFRRFRDEYLKDKKCELKEKIDSAVENNSFQDIDVILGDISKFFNENQKISPYKSDRCRNFGNLFAQFVKFLSNYFKILIDFDDLEIKEKYLLILEETVEFEANHLHSASFLRNNVFNIEINLRHEKIALNVYDSVSNLLQKYKDHNLIFIIDEDVLLEGDLDDIKTFKYMENFNKLVNPDYISNFTIKYYGCEFEFDKNGVIVDSNAEKMVLNGLTCFSLASSDLTGQIDSWIDDHELNMSGQAQSCSNNLFFTCFKNIYKFMNTFIVNSLKSDGYDQEDEKEKAKMKFLALTCKIRPSGLDFLFGSKPFELVWQDLKCFFVRYRKHSIELWFQNKCPQQFISKGCFIHISSDYFFIVETEDQANLNHLQNNFFMEKLTNRKKTCFSVNLNIHVSADQLTGQFFDFIFFKSIEANTISKDNLMKKAEIKFIQGKGLSTFFQYAIVNLRTLPHFLSKVDFFFCSFVPYGLNENIIFKSNKRKPTDKANLYLRECVLNSLVFFDSSIHELKLENCGFHDQVYIDDIEKIEISFEQNSETIFDVNGLKLRGETTREENRAESSYFKKDENSVKMDNLIAMSWYNNTDWYLNTCGLTFLDNLELNGVIFENSQKHEGDVQKTLFEFDVSRIGIIQIKRSVGTIFITDCNNLPDFYLTLDLNSSVSISDKFISISNIHITNIYGMGGKIRYVASEFKDFKGEVENELGIKIFS